MTWLSLTELPLPVMRPPMCRTRGGQGSGFWLLSYPALIYPHGDAGPSCFSGAVLCLWRLIDQQLAQTRGGAPTTEHALCPPVRGTGCPSSPG